MKIKEAVDLLVEKELFDQQYGTYLELLRDEEEEMNSNNSILNNKHGGDKHVNTT